MLKKLIRNSLKNLPYLRQAVFLRGAITGHFYSPIPSIEEVREREAELFDTSRQDLGAIDLNEKEQILLLQDISKYYADQPFPAERKPSLRYYWPNMQFGFSDAFFLHAMMRRVKPRKIIEVGSGYSSCAMLDTNDAFLDQSVSFTFIEPDTARLRSLLFPSDLQKLKIIERRVQQVSPEDLAALEDGDILFIDSSHVSKVGSDVHHIVFKVLPLLKRGVYVHFHEVIYPFEYIAKWVYDGKAWNESYLLHAFLQYNSAFKIELWPNFLARFHPELFATMPLCLPGPGLSIWLRKVA